MPYHVVVHVLSAHDLTNMDLLSESDPSIRLFLDSAKWDQYRTKVIDNDNNPVFKNEYFHFFFHKPTILHIVAEDADYTCWEEIGAAQYNIPGDHEHNLFHHVALDLTDSSKKYAGTVKLKIMVQQTWEPSPTTEFTPKHKNFPFKNLVIEGGGVRGIAYGGALQVLEELGITKQLVNVAGASAGAITALGIAMGCSATKATETLKETNFRNFMDGKITQFFSTYSFYKGEALSNFIKSQIDQTLHDLLPNDPLVGTKDRRENITFREHTVLIQKYPHIFKNLSVIGTNLTTQRFQVFNAQYSPDFPIWKAVRISMGIPLIFAPINVNGDLYIDGGVAYNYPIDLYDVDGEPNPETLGIKIDTPEELAQSMGHYTKKDDDIDQMTDSNSTGSSEAEPLSLSQYIGNLLNFLTNAASESRMTLGDDTRTIYIPTGSVGTSDFDLSEDKKLGLIQSGREWTEGYFRWWMSVPHQKVNLLANSIKKYSGKDKIRES